MQIIHVIGSLKIGGAEKLLKDLLPELKKKEIDLSLLVIGSGNPVFIEYLEKIGIKIILLNKSNIYNPLNIFSIYNSLKNYKYIHVHLFPSLYFISFTKLLDPKKILFYTEHNTKNKRRDKWYLKYLEVFLYNRYSKIISISKDTQINLKEWLSIEKGLERFCVIENGVNLEEYASALPAVLKESKNKRIILMVSRFSEQKDHLSVIKAFKIVANKRNNVHLCFVGEGKTLIEMKKIVEVNLLRDVVSFLGARNDVPNLIALSDIGLQSSYWEGFGLTAVEFMASGTPIIASDVKGLSEVVQNGGLLFKPGDYNDLAKIILMLLDDECFYQKISTQGTKKSQLYSCKKMANSYYDVYREFI